MNLIYQVAIGPKSKLYEKCISSAAAYADKIGADHIVQRTPKLRIRPNPLLSNRSKDCQSRDLPLPIFEKENAFDYIENYDQICILDSDVFVRPDAPSIFGALEDGSTFGAVVERDMPINQAYVDKIKNYSMMQYRTFPALFDLNDRGFEFMNMGVMLINCKKLKPYLKGQSPQQFLARPEFQPFVDGEGAWKWSTDQTLLNWWIRKEKMIITRMDWRWNGLYTANTRIEECHFVHFFLKDKLPNRGENVDQLMKDIHD